MQACFQPGQGSCTHRVSMALTTTALATISIAPSVVTLVQSPVEIPLALQHRGKALCSSSVPTPGKKGHFIQTSEFQESPSCRLQQLHQLRPSHKSTHPAGFTHHVGNQDVHAYGGVFQAQLRHQLFNPGHAIAHGVAVYLHGGGGFQEITISQKIMVKRWIEFG